MQDLFSLAGRTALVTGGSRGIGRMIAAGFLAQGARVYISARKAEACEQAARELSAHSGGRCIALRADVATLAGAAWGTPLADFPENGWDKVVDTNLKAPFFLTQALLPALRAAASAQRPADVINIASIDGISVNPLETYSYAASKAGLIQLTRRLALALVKGHVVVSAIAPGAFASDRLCCIKSPQASDAGQMSEAKSSKPRYKTTNCAGYNAALKARGSLTIWLDKQMQWYARASGRRGRRHTFSDAAIAFCLSIKCLFGLALRQSLGLVESLLRLAGLDWRVPDFSTVSRRQKMLQVALPYRPSATALDLLVDSTGIEFLGEGEWKRKKHGAEYRRQWRKVHLGIDAGTLEIRAIEVTDNRVGDAPMLPALLAQIPPHERVASVSGDGAYDTRACHAAIARRDALAVIPPRKNAQAWNATWVGASVRNEALRACQRLGRSIWKKWSGYHRRSLVETKMHCFKRLGERVMARTFERQVTELHVRVALLNRFTQLGRPTTVPVSALA